MNQSYQKSALGRVPEKLIAGTVGRANMLRDMTGESNPAYRASLSARYGRDSGSDPPSAVDGMFRTLVEQLER